MTYYHRNLRDEKLTEALRPHVGSGKSYAEIGRILGKSKVAIWKAMRRRGWSAQA